MRCAAADAGDATAGLGAGVPSGRGLGLDANFGGFVADEAVAYS